jgi:hypothetical protein
MRLGGVALLRVLLATPALFAWALVHAATPTLPSSVAPACSPPLGEGAREVTQGHLKLWWRAVPDPIPLNQAFELMVQVCGDGAELLRVDADMPAHRHGMNYRATLTQAEAQRTRVKGMVFHMPGRWRLMFDVQQGGQRLRLTDTIDLQ